MIFGIVSISSGPLDCLCCFARHAPNWFFWGRGCRSLTIFRTHPELPRPTSSPAATELAPVTRQRARPWAGNTSSNEAPAVASGAQHCP